MEYKVTAKPINDYIAKHNISEKEFCEKFELQKNTYDKIIRGEKVVLTKLFVLAHNMNLSLNDFLA